MLDVFIDTVIDLLKLFPFLFLTYFIMELLENKAGEKVSKMIQKSGKFGPILGAILGIVPQCGFSAAAANLYAARIITIGSLFAIFLSTSDEMLPILISSGASISLIMKILFIKLFIGMTLGILIDLFFIKKNSSHKDENNIHKICENEHCHCEENGIVISSISHTLHIFIYIFFITFFINLLIFLIGKDHLENLLVNIPILGNIIATLVGLIPNCASSVILTQLYLQNMLPLGCLISGLLANSGIGLLVLFKVNKSIKQNMSILIVLFIIGAISGILIDLLL